MSSPKQTLATLWAQAALPPATLAHVSLTGADAFPSSFNLDQLAQASIGAAALAASQLLSLRSSHPPVNISLDSMDVAAEFRFELLATLDGEVGRAWDELAGVYKAKDGWLRPHTNWPHHKLGVLRMLGLPDDARREDVARAILEVEADAFAETAMEMGLVVTALRSFGEWDAHPQGKAALTTPAEPVTIQLLHPRPAKPFPALSSTRPLEGVRVLDLTRVIAGPTAGRILATYGADVLWVTAPHLPTLPGIDFATSLNKRTIQLDLRPSPSSPTSTPDQATFHSLVRTADVVLQAYRPGALASLGLSVSALLELNSDLVYANLSAWGEGGPWEGRKGFDSLVQFGTGVGEAEGRSWREWRRQNGEEVEGEEAPTRALPCHALDYASGYLLAFGIQGALYHRATTGGSYYVNNSLLATATWLRSLGRAPPEAFARELETREELVARGGMEEVVGFEGKTVVAVKHSVKFDGAEFDCTRAPRGCGGRLGETL